eukprot:s376_g4.t1
MGNLFTLEEDEQAGLDQPLAREQLQQRQRAQVLLLSQLRQEAAGGPAALGLRPMQQPSLRQTQVFKNPLHDEPAPELEPLAEVEVAPTPQKRGWPRVWRLLALPPLFALALLDLINAAAARSRQPGSLAERALAAASKLPAPRFTAESQIQTILDKKKDCPLLLELCIATCGVSASIAAEKLVLSGLQIESSIYHCAPDKPTRRACATDITGVFASISAAGSYLAAVSHACPKDGTSKAECASDILDILYGVGTLASALASIEDDEYRTQSHVIAPNRRGPTLGMCVINVAQAASYIAHAVISVRAAAVDCPNRQQTNRAAACTTQVSGALQSFSLVAAYLSNAAAMCGATAVAGADCSNRIGSVVAGMAEVSAGGSASALHCIRNASSNSTTRPR